MRVGIIAANNIRVSPYVFYYTSILDILNMEYEVIVPNRNKELKDTYEFSVHILPWDENRNTFSNYVAYSKNVKKYVVGKFDFLIVLTTMSAVFCAYWLKRYYFNKYIVDIRDYTHEDNFFFYLIEKYSLKNASIRIISSDKFRSFLPEMEYWVCHNINTPEEKSEFVLQKKNGRIIIGYIGAISYAEQCKKIIQLVANDARFEFHVYGMGVAENEIRQYASKFACDRIKFFGAYCQKDKGAIIQKVDILFNVYGTGTPLLDCALSNKLYDALYYRKPLLTSIGTYMANVGSEITLPIDLENKNCLNKTWDWYQKLDINKINTFSEQKLKALKFENNYTKSRILMLLKDLK